MIEVFSHSEVGGHAHNEDAFDVRLHPEITSCYLCVVADGQGGQQGGGPAARLACARCPQLALNNSLAQLLRPSTWTTLLHSVDESVAHDPAAGFTTLAAFCVTPTAICGASSGDSAVVLFTAGSRGSILTERQHKNPPVGSGDAVFVPFAASLVTPWTVLAMTDGVWKYAGWESVLEAAAFGNSRDVVSRLRERAVLSRSGKLQDDFTLVVLRGQTA